MTYIYIYTDTNPITLPCSLARAGNYLVHHINPDLEPRGIVLNSKSPYLEYRGPAMMIVHKVHIYNIEAMFKIVHKSFIFRISRSVDR